MKKGQITVFFSMILLVLMALVCTSLESARAAGMSLRLRLVADSSLQSAFAQYDRTLWEEYGLLFRHDRDTTGSELIGTVTSYAEKNEGNDSQLMGMDLLAYRTERADVLTLVTAVDQNGQVFRQAVTDYMRSSGAAEAAVELFGRLDVIDEFGDLTEDGAMLKARGEEEADPDRIQEEYESLREELTARSKEMSGETSKTESAEHEETGSVSREQAESTVSSLMGTIKDFTRYGFLAFVVDDISIVSDEPLDMEDLPSSMSPEEKGKITCDLPEPVPGESLIFNEYIIRHLDAYTSEDSRGCQVEYVIAGKKSDLENLSSVAGRLILIREGFNMAYIVTDQVKRAQADGIAAVIAGWTGIPLLVTGLSMVILAAWSFGESAADVRSLLQGEEVPLLKTKENWKLSLEGVASVNIKENIDIEKVTPEIMTSDKTVENDSNSVNLLNGLSYEDYLRILLFFMDQEEVTYRTMDVIQMTVREHEPNFRMDQCIYGARAELEISSDTIFPFLPGSVDYSISTVTEFSYGEVVAYIDDED